MVQSDELQTREAEIFAIDDYGYYRKFYLSPGPESGYSGSPLFRKEKNGLILIGIVAGKVVQQNPDGTTKDLKSVMLTPSIKFSRRLRLPQI